MEAVLIVLAVMSTPVAILGVLRHYRYKERQLAAGGGAGGDQKALQARCEELEARIQTLETIVCEGDLEAAAKIRALARRADGGSLPASTKVRLLAEKNEPDES